MNDMLIDILTATLYYMSNIKIETLYEKLTYWSNQQHFEQRELFSCYPKSVIIGQGLEHSTKPGDVWSKQGIVCRP